MVGQNRGQILQPNKATSLVRMTEDHLGPLFSINSSYYTSPPPTIKCPPSRPLWYAIESFADSAKCNMSSRCFCLTLRDPVENYLGHSQLRHAISNSSFGLGESRSITLSVVYDLDFATIGNMLCGFDPFFLNFLSIYRRYLMFCYFGSWFPRKRLS